MYVYQEKSMCVWIHRCACAHCLELVAMAASWSTKRSGESDFCGKVMNLASTGTEMDFLSQPVNHQQETHILHIFGNALNLLLMLKKKEYQKWSPGVLSSRSLSLATSTIFQNLMKWIFTAEWKGKRFQHASRIYEDDKYSPSLGEWEMLYQMDGKEHVQGEKHQVFGIC